MAAADVHHRIPRHLLRLRDRLDAHTEIDQEGWGLWEDYHEECWRYGVNPDVSRIELAAMVETSTVEIAGEDHRASHSAAGDFARWGRLGGLETLRRYGPPWFSLLGQRRWGRVGAEALDRHRARTKVTAGAA